MIEDRYVCDDCDRGFTSKSVVETITIKKHKHGSPFETHSYRGVLCKDCLSEHGASNIPNPTRYVGISQGDVIGARVPSYGRGSEYGEYKTIDDIDDQYIPFFGYVAEVFG